MLSVDHYNWANMSPLLVTMAYHIINALRQLVVGHFLGQSNSLKVVFREDIREMQVKDLAALSAKRV